jgi:hypothetical protein
MRLVIEHSRGRRAARPRTGHRLRAVLVVLVAGIVAGCGADASTPATPSVTRIPATQVRPSPTAGPSNGTAATPTVVPGGVTVSPGPPGTRIPTTQTDWGAILDALPDGFPVYPGAAAGEPPAEPVSATFDTADPVDRVAGWYQQTLVEAGFSQADLSDPLEDGSRVLDVASDIPECRIQLTFRPLGGSTMISVLYGAGCAGAGP